MQDSTEKHCDDYIDDPTQPECLRKFLEYARSPGHGSDQGKKPQLYATLACPEGSALDHVKQFKGHQGQRVKVNMASRMGDVGISSELDSESGYFVRVLVDWLKDFSETP